MCVKFTNKYSLLLLGRQQVSPEVLAARKANLITALTHEKKKRNARMFANVSKDHTIPLFRGGGRTPLLEFSESTLPARYMTRTIISVSLGFHLRVSKSLRKRNTRSKMVGSLRETRTQTLHAEASKCGTCIHGSVK